MNEIFLLAVFFSGLFFGLLIGKVQKKIYWIFLILIVINLMLAIILGVLKIVFFAFICLAIFELLIVILIEIYEGKK